MKVNCIHCGHAFGLDDSYADYEGFVRCGTCSGLLDVKIKDGMMRGVRPGSFAAPQPAAQAPIQAPPQAPAIQPAATPNSPPAHTIAPPISMPPAAGPDRAEGGTNPNREAA